MYDLNRLKNPSQKGGEKYRLLLDDSLFTLNQKCKRCVNRFLDQTARLNCSTKINYLSAHKSMEKVQKLTQKILSQIDSRQSISTILHRFFFHQQTLIGKRLKAGNNKYTFPLFLNKLPELKKQLFESV